MLLLFKSGRRSKNLALAAVALWASSVSSISPTPHYWSFFALAGATLPPNRPEPLVHRKRYSRTSHTGHNKKYQAKSEYRIGKVQRTNRATHPKKQGPCGQA